MNAEGDGELWPFKLSDAAVGGVRAVRVPTQLSLNNAGAALDAALQGHGLARVRAYQVVDHLQANRLVSVLDAFEPPPVPVHLVFHPDVRRQAILRAFVDHAVPLLRAELTRVAVGMAPASGLMK